MTLHEKVANTVIASARAHSFDFKRMESVLCEDVDGHFWQQTTEYSSKQTPEKEYK